jgi:hypothetical protein
VIDNSNTSTEHDILSDSGTSRDARLSRDERIVAYHHVVSDLHQVVDFDALANGGSSKRRAVYGSVSSYLHVILHLDNPYLRYFNSLIAFPCVAKPVAPYDNPRMQHYSVSNPTAITHDHIWM